MAFRPVLYTLAAAMLLTTVFSSTSEAQWRGARQPGQTALRWLGQGYGAGYHWRTPGPNTDYYNPYSAHNSLLLSQQGGGYPIGSYSSNGSMPEGSPSSLYAPNGMGAGSQNQAGALITPTFEPAESEQDSDPVTETDDSFDDSDDSDFESENNEVRSGLRLDSNDFKPASYSKQAQPATNSNSDWSLSDPFDD